MCTFVSLSGNSVGGSGRKMKNTSFLVLVFVAFKYTHTQYLAIGSNHKQGSTSICDTTAKSALVEHFFNLIFTEFHNTAPVCVCVQMCAEQPTYCYPNGCLRIGALTKKVEDPVLPVQKINENANSIFFIDDNNDFMNDFLTKNNEFLDDFTDENTPIVAPVAQKPEKPVTTIMRPDPFKDRYKMLFNYKKSPKVELKYNLAEQVKNMKSEVLKTDNADVSNTRWPLNKFDRRLTVGKRSGPNNPITQQSSSNPKYFLSMYPDKDGNYPPKYFKRELLNDTNRDMEIKAIYVVGKSETESNIFSLEKLIDSLIESSFDKNASSPDTGAKTVINETIAQNQEPNEKAEDNTTNSSMKNETTNIISMNLKNETVDKNKYSDDIKLNNSNDFSQMIATLSKRIDIQNNTSLEIMKDRTETGVFEDESVSSTSEKPIETTLYTETENSTTEHITEPTVYETKTTRKIRKRIVRRLQNGKNN